MDTSHPFPHLINKARYIAVRLCAKGKEKEQFGLIPVPEALPRTVFLPGSAVRYLLTEQILLAYAEDVFSMYTVCDKAVICVTRNADINPDDENFEVDDDYRRHMKRVIKKRARLACVRLELFGGEVSTELREFLMRQLALKKEQVFKSKTPLDLSYVYGLSERMTPAARKSMTYRPFKPMPSAMVNPNESVTKQVMKRDLFLSYPYESMEPFLKLVEEAAVDPAVVSIKITIYRLASSSRLVEALTKASENGKDVVALLELRARFDEQNNINWSETLEDAGCQVLYGMEDYKVHSKICLITRQEKGKVQYITQIGTGNYNEKTAKLYTDFCLMTSDMEIGQDASEFFKNMALSNLDGEYHALMVAPNAMQSRIIEKIDEMIAVAAAGGNAHMMIKTNSVTDRVLIDRLQAASDAGVKIEMVVRGICCILPQIPSKKENITVTSVVGRFLEHSRVYCFMANGESEVYISSADFMTRNMTRRVEIACPVKSQQVKQRIIDFMLTMLHDNVKARRLMRDGSYLPVSNSEAPLSCQDAFMIEAEEAASHAAVKPHGVWQKMTARFRKKKQQ